MLNETEEGSPAEPDGAECVAGVPIAIAGARKPFADPYDDSAFEYARAAGSEIF